MLIDHRRLRAAAGIRVIEIEWRDRMFTEAALERGVTVHCFGWVKSHISIVVS
jgi:hypothetical protein